MAGDLLRLCVPCDEHAPGTVRAALAELQELGWLAGDVMLVSSELVANAVRHSGCSGEDQLVVSVVANDCVKITVTDPGISGKRAEIAQRDLGFGGLGLSVVDQLAEAWGTERHPEGSVVWAELSGAPGGGSGWSPAASRSEES
jgi:anti-sigma regulatory factor (Ser/Thr protein kinase)